VRRKWEEEGGLVVRVYREREKWRRRRGWTWCRQYEGKERPYLKNKS
jgi:hypothetical protein